MAYYGSYIVQTFGMSLSQIDEHFIHLFGKCLLSSHSVPTTKCWGCSDVRGSVASQNIGSNQNRTVFGDTFGTGSLWWVPIQYDWSLYKKGKFEHRYILKEDSMKE